jgi:hypothetical protein
MDGQEIEEIRPLLREELQDFFSWIMEELGGEYFIEHPERSPSSWEQEVQEKIHKRLQSERANIWERDLHAFFDHPQRPSVYRILDAEDLELLHSPEEFYCEHFKLQDAVSEGEDSTQEQGQPRFDQSFSVLLASHKSGWMYRLVFCETCGLIEIWSMRYDPNEISGLVDGA